MFLETETRNSQRRPMGAEVGKTLVMGIVNVTPDSFSDGGQYFSPANAIRYAYQLIEDGADILDIGAESTRPTSSGISAEEEWARLEPVLRELCTNSPVPISVDTFKAKTAHNALDIGVDIINDVWGGLADLEMLPLISQAGCDYIWMHNRIEPPQGDGLFELMEETQRGIERCLEAGIAGRHLWIDPGIGFGKTYPQNLTALRRLDDYCTLGYPVLLGTSRKSVIGNTLHVPVGERLEGSLATVSIGVWAGIQAVRVHDVKETVRACHMVEAILHAN